MYQNGYTVNSYIYGVSLIGYDVGMEENEDFEFNNLLAAALLEKRAELGISYRRLEELTGVPHMTIQRYLTQEREMKTNAFEKIARALGLSPWRVMRQAEQELATNHDTPPITEAFIQNLQEGLATGKYAYAAKPHTPDPYDTIGQESQIPANWEE